MADIEEHEAGGMSRRTLIKRSAIVGGTVLWAAPVVQSFTSPAFGQVGTAEEICGRMTYGGFIDTVLYGRVTYGGELHCGTPAVPPNRLEVNWEGGNNFHLTGDFTSSCLDTPAIETPPAADFDTLVGSGTGTLNQQAGYSVEITLTDSGEPGTADTISLTISDSNGVIVLQASGPVSGGNIQAHAATGSKAC